MHKVIRDLNTKKNCQTSDTQNFSNLIYKHFKYCIDKGEFSNDLKYADNVLVYKKITNAKKTSRDYRPLGIL